MEYYFSDINLATTDYLMRFMSKDPEGFGKIDVSLLIHLAKYFSFIDNYAV